MSQANLAKDSILNGETLGQVDRLSISQLCYLWDDTYPDGIETGSDGSSIAFTYDDGSILILKDEGSKITLQLDESNYEPDDHSEDPEDSD